MNMKSITFCPFLVILVCFFASCKDSSTGEPHNPYFYVQYNADLWATVDFNKSCIMTIADENGKEVKYTIGSRDVIIGPVYVGYTAKMTVSSPYDGGNNGRISIARNSDKLFTTYASFANSQNAETLKYTIRETTGK